MCGAGGFHSRMADETVDSGNSRTETQTVLFPFCPRPRTLEGQIHLQNTDVPCLRLTHGTVQ